MRRGLLLSLASLAVALFAAWLALPLVVPKNPSGWGWQGSPRRALQPPDAATEVNALGLRGQAFEYSPQDLVVLLVGDSQVEAADSAKGEMPEALLEHSLGQRLGRPVRVFSLGAAAWGQDQQLLALEKYFARHRADLVLAWATPTNDFWENTFADRSTSAEAGPFKPTFRLREGALEGPFYATDFYYEDSVVRDLLARAWAAASGAPKPRQAIVDRWIASLPPPRPLHDGGVDCSGSIEMAQERFFGELFDLDGGRTYTVVTRENVAQGRSHFSPLATPSTSLDEYEKALTRALFARMASLAREKGAQFRVFYPLREDFDRRTGAIVCVKTDDGRTYGFQARFEALLRETVAPDNLIAFAIEGHDEIAVAKTDRHLNALGNRRAMAGLADALARLGTKR